MTVKDQEECEDQVFQRDVTVIYEEHLNKGVRTQAAHAAAAGCRFKGRTHMASLYHAFVLLIDVRWNHELGGSPLKLRLRHMMVLDMQLQKLNLIFKLVMELLQGCLQLLSTLVEKGFGRNDIQGSNRTCFVII